MIVTYIFSPRQEDQIRIQIRIRNLADAINRTGLHRANLLDVNSFIENSQDAQKVCAQSDILIIYRYLYGRTLTAVQYWKARGKKIIVDFDQGVDCLAPEMPDYAFWFEGVPFVTNGENDIQEDRIEPVPLEQFKEGLKFVDAATVSSAWLTSDWARQVTVYELPDYLNTSQYPILNQARDDETWIGLGQSVQYASFRNSGLAAAMEQICRKYPRVRLVLCSPCAELNTDLNIDRQQVVLYSPRSFDEWVKLLLNLDIGLAPAFSDFDLRLSPANLFEFMISKIPWVATKQFALHNLDHYGCWAQNTPESWEEAITKVIEQLDLYKKKACGEPFLYALGQDISVNIPKTLQMYADILDRGMG